MDDRRKRLFYQANHRGMMETDTLVGGYATLALEGMDDTRLAEFERILEENDNDLMSWLLEREPVPERINGPMMKKLIEFKKSL